MVDKGDNCHFSTVYSAHFAWCNQHRAESLKPMQWQKYYFRVCLFSNHPSKGRFGSPGLCIAPGGHLWLLHLSACEVIQEQNGLGQRLKKEMVSLLAPEVFPNPHMRNSLALAYEKEMTLEGRGHLCLFQENFDSYATFSMERKAFQNTNTRFALWCYNMHV